MSVALYVPETVSAKDRRLQYGRAIVRKARARWNLVKVRKGFTVSLAEYRKARAEFIAASDLADAWSEVCTK